MPIFQQRDQEQARRSLTRWLATKLPDAGDVTISGLGGPAATGYSNETILFDATWQTRRPGSTHQQGFAIRVKPSTHTVFLESEFETQYRVLKILGEQTDIPIPRVSWYEEDESVLGAPFFVMERISGCQVPGDSPPYTMGGWPCDAPPEQQETLWWNGLDVMARIHRLDWESLGLGFLAKPERGKTGLDQQLAYYQSYFEWAAAGRPQPSVQAIWDWLLANRPAQDSNDAVCWGDSRIGNIMFDGDCRVRAVLDWEMVALGNPLQDVAWYLILDRYQSEGYDAPRLPGFPGREATVARWQQLTGRSADDLDWYERWAAFRFGVVMIRIAQLLVHFELMPPDSDLERNNGATRIIDALLVPA